MHDINVRTCTSSVRHGEGGINEMTIMNDLRAIKTISKKYKKLCMWEKSVDSRAVLIIKFLVSLFIYSCKSPTAIKKQA